MKVINGIKMFTTKELQDLLGVGYGTITAMRSKGLIRSVNIGKGLYTSEESLADYLNGKTKDINSKNKKEE